MHLSIVFSVYKHRFALSFEDLKARSEEAARKSEEAINCRDRVLTSAKVILDKLYDGAEELIGSTMTSHEAEWLLEQAPTQFERKKDEFYFEAVERTMGAAKSLYGKEYDLAQVVKGFRVDSPSELLNFMEEVHNSVGEFMIAVGLRDAPAPAVESVSPTAYTGGTDVVDL